MAELAFDVVEEILVLLDVEDLIRCQCVCKSWQSIIYRPRFVKAHLNHSYNNDLNNHELGHRRIANYYTDEDDLLGYNYMDEYDWLTYNRLHVVGSCNGLVCVSPVDAEFVITNPSTRERKKLPKPPYLHDWRTHLMVREEACWGFGYDSSTDDYKVIAGFTKKNDKGMLFHVLTLKSNTWKVIGEVKYSWVNGISGILCGGALHWFMNTLKKKVIISLDLSTEEFKEIPQPTDEEYECDVFDEYKLGVIEECLCIFWDLPPFSSKKWVMKNNKWELYNDHCENKYDVAHGITPVGYKVYSVTNGECVSSVGAYIRASVYVKSLVSPHPYVTSDNTYEGRKRNAKHGKEGIEVGNIKKRKRNMRKKRPCKHKKPLVWI